MHLQSHTVQLQLHTIMQLHTINYIQSYLNTRKYCFYSIVRLFW